MHVRVYMGPCPIESFVVVVVVVVAYIKHTRRPFLFFFVLRLVAVRLVWFSPPGGIFWSFEV